MTRALAAAALLALNACSAGLEWVTPAPEVVAVALSGKKNAGNLGSQALARAGAIKTGMGFLYDRRGAQAALKLAKPKAPADLAQPTVEPRTPSGTVARVTVSRSPDEREKLARTKVIRVIGEGTSNDPGKAQMKAEASLVREAIVRAAKARSISDPILRGRLRFVNYAIAEEGRLVTVSADVAVYFVLPEPASVPIAVTPTGPATVAVRTKARDDDEPLDDAAKLDDIPPLTAGPASQPSNEMNFDAAGPVEMVFE